MFLNIVKRFKIILVIILFIWLLYWWFVWWGLLVFQIMGIMGLIVIDENMILEGLNNAIGLVLNKRGLIMDE